MLVLDRIINISQTQAQSLIGWCKCFANFQMLKLWMHLMLKTRQVLWVGLYIDLELELDVPAMWMSFVSSVPIMLWCWCHSIWVQSFFSFLLPPPFCCCVHSFLLNNGFLEGQVPGCEWILWVSVRQRTRTIYGFCSFSGGILLILPSCQLAGVTWSVKRQRMVECILWTKHVKLIKQQIKEHSVQYSITSKQSPLNVFASVAHIFVSTYNLKTRDARDTAVRCSWRLLYVLSSLESVSLFLDLLSFWISWSLKS